jgi:transposase-like protein
VNPSIRLFWNRFYEQTEDFGFVYRRCGMSRPTLRKWWRRFQVEGKDGFQEKIPHPHKMPLLTVTRPQDKLILNLRLQPNLEAGRIQAELICHRNFEPDQVN